ncbi:hypothetical protein Daesc_000772 [Daldinia eschscholtzii]|uniref:F-box domain-containing protein n=1 Tax=Daldinia eschscholtzii TaxID=292717 RepID=A0AAX6MZ89_9PEZI
MDHHIQILPLPPELFYTVFSYLSPLQARTLRRVCRAFSVIGAQYGYESLTIYLCDGDFAMLRYLATHPVISKAIRRLTYANHCLEKPNKGDVPYYSMNEYLIRTTNEKMRKRVLGCRLNWLPDDAAERNPMSAEDIEKNYRHYRSAVEYQERALANGEDYKTFKAVLPKFTMLEDVTVTTDPITSSSPFSAFFVSTAISPRPWCSRQLKAIMHGLRGSGIQIRSLTALKVDSRLIRRDFLSKITSACGELEWINLWFEDNGVILPALHPAAQDMWYQGTKTREIATFLEALPTLKSIVLVFSQSRYRHAGYAGLNNIITPGFKWRDLREVCLSQIKAAINDLFSFFELHRLTLEVIHLSHCTLSTSSWVSLLWQMKKSLKLREISLSKLLIGDSEAVGDISDPNISPTGGREYWELEYHTGNEFSVEISRWFVHDGPCPLTPERLASIRI